MKRAKQMELAYSPKKHWKCITLFIVSDANGLPGKADSGKCTFLFEPKVKAPAHWLREATLLVEVTSLAGDRTE